MIPTPSVSGGEHDPELEGINFKIDYSIRVSAATAIGEEYDHRSPIARKISSKAYRFTFRIGGSVRVNACAVPLANRRYMYVSKVGDNAYKVYNKWQAPAAMRKTSGFHFVPQPNSVPFTGVTIHPFANGVHPFANGGR